MHTTTKKCHRKWPVCGSARTGIDSVSIPVVRTKQQWKPRPQGWTKVNTDASFCPITDEASAGIVARDDEGKVMLTAWRILRRCNSAEEAEVEAYLEGLRLAAEWIRQPTWAETDCSQHVKAEARPCKQCG
jgi:hypothetical protein